MSNAFPLILFLFLQFPFHLFSCSCFSFTSSLWKINRQYLICAYVSSSPSFTAPFSASSLCVLSSSLYTLSSSVIVKHRSSITSAPASFALSSPSAHSVPYLCPHHSISVLFCFVLPGWGVGWGGGGQPVFRSLVFLSSVVSRILFIPLLVCCLSGAFTCHCPFPDEDLV